MGLAQYAIVPVRDQWGVLHDGNVNGEYATKELAFESAIAAASLAIRMGHEVHVSVPARHEGEAALTQRADRRFKSESPEMFRSSGDYS